MKHDKALELYFLQNYRAAYNEIANLERDDDWFCLYAMIARKVFNLPTVISELDTIDSPLTHQLIQIINDKLDVDLEIKNDLAKLFLAEMFYQRADYQSSLNVLYKADNVDPFTALTYLRALNYLALNRRDLSINYHDLLIKQAYDSNLTLLINVFASLVEGSSKDALNTIKEISQHHSTEFVKELEAACLLACGKIEESWEILRQMIGPEAKKQTLFNALSCLEILSLKDESYINEYEKCKKFIEEA